MSNKHKARRCDICKEHVTCGNLRRHQKRCKLNALPIEHAKTVTDVLRACGFGAETLGDWDLEQLDSLPNFRQHKPTPRRHHTQWKVVKDEQTSTMPSLEEVLLDFRSRLQNRGQKCSVYNGTEVWLHNKHIQFTPREFSTWTRQILEGDELKTRVLNMPMDFVRTEAKREYHQFAEDALREHLPDLSAHGFQQNRAEANITPRGTRTEVHHDSEHSVSLAVGFKSRSGRPLKLWLLWPSTELRHLASCYSDTKAALDCMDHGSFLVQMPGESVIVPPNSPHAVFTLDSCYLYGHTFSTEHWAYEPSSVFVNMRVGDSADEACRARVTQSRLGLRGSAEVRRAHVGQFLETWASEKGCFEKHKGLLEELVAIWAYDRDDRGSCALCDAVGERESLGQSSEEHARAHLVS
jgi:hypothetical protein